jgi:hypothetical protein
MRRHNEILHKDKLRALEEKLREDKLKNLKCHSQRQQDVFTVATKTNEPAIQASFCIINNLQEIKNNYGW